MEGDGEAIIQAVKNYPAHGRDKDQFWIKACQALGWLADTPAATALMEWAGKYKFMEHKKNRSLEVRRAAVGALAHFRSPTVRDFLTSLLAEGEKELHVDVEESLKSVQNNILGLDSESPA